MVNHITFNHNWNNKLDCNCFTTLRLHNPKKYKVGDIKEIWLCKNKQWYQLGRAEIVQIKTFELEKINDFIAYLDTGYNRSETINIVRKMYKKSNPTMDFILLKRLGNDFSTTQAVLHSQPKSRTVPGH